LPSLATVFSTATFHTLLPVTVSMFKYDKYGDVTTFCNSNCQLPSNRNLTHCSHYSCTIINVLKSTNAT
jgi:hypothetical protein